ncbi:MAG: DNA repair protein RecN [Parvularculaceae bacterium]
MLTALHIQDFVLIDQLSLPLGQGLTALTGETGAGKSILLEALGLAAGGRMARGAVRRGAAKGVVAAAFEPGADHPVWAALETNAISAGDDDQVILKRIQGADGKSRAFINDQPVSIGLLKTIGEMLIEIHGQHDGVSFLSASTHRGLLDDFGGLAVSARNVDALWSAWRDIEGEIDERRRARDQNLREADYLRHVVAELGELAAAAGEETALAEKRGEMMAAQKVTEDLAAAASVMSEDALEGRLSSAAHRLVRASAAFGAEDNPLSEAIEKIERALSEVLEAKSAVEDAAERLCIDERELEETEERLFALRAAARKHGVTTDLLPEFYEKAAAALSTIDDGEARFGDLEAQAKKARAAYFAAAGALSDARVAAAATLDAAVARELEPLKLGKAVFATRIARNDDKPGAAGVDAVEFMVATNPGAPLGPLKTIASGGELSRFVLAMKAALAAKENRTVIIFDEVDAGVGGAVADAVGERLARLAMDAQVLVVTHSPQVAARAATQWRVEKDQDEAQTVTRVRALDADERIEEIARMLSGATVSDEARAAARRLLGAPAAKRAKAPKRKRA